MRATRLSGLVLLACVAGCPNQPGQDQRGTRNINGTFSPAVDTSWSGTIEADTIAIVAGVTFRADGDLTLRSRGGIEIAGDVIAEGGTGQSIVLEAEGDITILGQVLAGGGAPGGGLTMVSNSGNIILVDGSLIASGNGVSGVAPDASAGFVGGAGFKGGDLVLRAANGSITFASTPGSVQIGSGGDAADIVISRGEQVELALPEQFTNSGGDSGAAEFSAPQLLGLGFDEVVLTEDYIVDDQVRATTGSTVRLLVSDQIVGGTGGRTGSVSVGLDSETHVFDPATAKRSARSAGSDFELLKIVRGAAGARGIRSPTNGGDVSWIGRDGEAPGQGGQDVLATGGQGGHCSEVRVIPPLMLIPCTSGNGGSAFAWGGNGAKGADPGGIGGLGGSAEAVGGAAGLYAVFTFGCKGGAEARGGNGGAGGNGCPTGGGVGGGGGGGGNAAAKYPGDRPTVCGPTGATGGNGGNGGDGQRQGGPGGARGEATRDELVGDVIQHGLPGRPGKKGQVGPTCPPPASNGCGALAADFVDAPAAVPPRYTIEVANAAGTPTPPYPQFPGGNNDHRRTATTYATIPATQKEAATSFEGTLTKITRPGIDKISVFAVTNSCRAVGAYEAGGLEYAFWLDLRDFDLLTPRPESAPPLNLIPKPAGAISANALDISEDLGGGNFAIIGNAIGSNGVQLAYVYAGGESIELPSGREGGPTYASGISRDARHIVGTDGPSGAVWTGENYQMLTLLPPLTPGGRSNALAAHAPWIVGGSSVGEGLSKRFRQVRWNESGGMPVELGTPEGEQGFARAISPAGVIVGNNVTAAGAFYGTVYTEADGLVNLNSRIDPALGWHILNAIDVNRAHDILVVGARSDGTQAILTLRTQFGF